LIAILRNIKHNIYSAVLLSSLSGFLMVGIVDSPFDAPRLGLLFFLMLFLSLTQLSLKKIPT